MHLQHFYPHECWLGLRHQHQVQSRLQVRKAISQSSWRGAKRSNRSGRLLLHKTNTHCYKASFLPSALSVLMKIIMVINPVRYTSRRQDSHNIGTECRIRWNANWPKVSTLLLFFLSLWSSFSSSFLSFFFFSKNKGIVTDVNSSSVSVYFTGLWWVACPTVTQCECSRLARRMMEVAT